MNTIKFLSLFMIETFVLLVLIGCSGDIDKLEPETKSTDIYQMSTGFETEAVTGYDKGVHVNHTPILNPVNENYIFAEISGEGIQCGEFTMFECNVKKKMIDEGSAWLKKIYIPNSALSSIKEYTTLLAAVKVVSYEDGLISDDGRSYSIIMREDGSLCCIPFDESGAAVVDGMHYLDLRYGDNSEYMINGAGTTPYQYAAAENDSYGNENTESGDKDSPVTSIIIEHEKKYREARIGIFPDYLIENGTSLEDAEKYFDALEKAKELEDDLYDNIRDDLNKIGYNVMF
ncbi:MAG: hypothetical protein U0M08_04910 [Clostridia bacterium]|nr:hypothetical protein [Clostridia bacterium]